MSGECDKCSEHATDCKCLAKEITVDCISDLHGHYPRLEGGDLLIIAGDLTRGDDEYEYVALGMWLHKQPYRKKILVAGNHDNFLQASNCPNPIPGCDYLCDSGTEFEGLKIWGSPWTQIFAGVNRNCRAFMLDSEKALKWKWKLIPKDTDILITHSPPFGHGDKVHKYKRDKRGNQILVTNEAGSRSLASITAKIRPKLHVFGHVHEGYGHTWSDEEPRTGYINASHVTENYEPNNPPIRIVLKCIQT